jgi:MHS family proline/betaine transporter-like MFS transporter
LKNMMASHRRTIVLGILSMAAPSVGIYLMVYYMPQYLVRTLHMSATVSLLSAVFSSALIFLFLPFLAKIADRHPSRKVTQYITMTASLVLAYPCFFALTQNMGEPLSLLIIAGYSALLLSNNAATTVMMLEAFPSHHRATGVSMIYSFGVTIFGAFCPLLVTWLIKVTGDPLAPAWYLLTALCISLFALIYFPDAIEECR